MSDNPHPLAEDIARAVVAAAILYPMRDLIPKLAHPIAAPLDREKVAVILMSISVIVGVYVVYRVAKER